MKFNHITSLEMKVWGGEYETFLEALEALAVQEGEANSVEAVWSDIQEAQAAGLLEEPAEDAHLESAYEELSSEYFFDFYDYEPNPYDGTYSEM